MQMITRMEARRIAMDHAEADPGLHDRPSSESMTKTHYLFEFELRDDERLPRLVILIDKHTGSMSFGPTDD